MDEYIEREAISEEIRKYYYKNPPNFSYGEGFDRGLDRAQRAILDAPAADVAPVRHGRWVQVICHEEFEDGFVDHVKECCSVCHAPNGRKTTNYCPDCGAKMDGGVSMDVREKVSNKKRLIDANALKERAIKMVTVNSLGNKQHCYFKAVGTDEIDKAPTVDAVEVVRCRDFKHRGTDDCIFHIKGEPADEELLRKLDNDFCSYGERKDSDGNG